MIIKAWGRPQAEIEALSLYLCILPKYLNNYVFVYHRAELSTAFS